MTYRKHPGINQRTGQLKKGFYYTSNRTYSGAAEIRMVDSDFSNRSSSSFSMVPFLGLFLFAIVLSPSVVSADVVEQLNSGFENLRTGFENLSFDDTILYDVFQMK